MASLDRKEGALGHKLAAHLLRRMCYNYSNARILEFAEYSPNKAVNILSTISADAFPFPIDDDSGSNIFVPNSNINNGKRQRIVENWWIHNALKDKSVNHKMQFFLHTCFTVGLSNTLRNYLEFYEHIKLIDFYSIGNYKTFAYKMSLDIFMSKYLQNSENRVGFPNENYAREILELFTIGKGPQIDVGDYTNYTEHDVVEASKVLTGWRVKVDAPIDPDTGLRQIKPQKGFHDSSDKIFSHAFNYHEIKGRNSEEGMYEELSEFIEMVFQQEETSRFIIRKLYRYFVAREITEEIEQDIIIPLAQIFRENDYEIIWPLRKLMKSQHFYDEMNRDENDTIIGGMVKSPLEYTLGFLSYFKVNIPAHNSTNPNDRKRNYNFFTSLKDILAFGGMKIFSPDQVAGYPAYYQQPLYDKAWINSQTIICRYKFGEMMTRSQVLLNDKFLASISSNMQSYVPTHTKNGALPYLLIKEITEDLFAEEIDDIRHEQLTNICLGLLSTSDYAREYSNLKNGEASDDIKAALNNIVINITKTPEFQLM